ncbi:lipid droplet localized protein-like [Galleria mellonella]|uniref:Lipid droplet localized protein-like n=1 Tax=Galleria mellonella TaxID=7137 RepID=A0A6J1WU76_GALME|nr:lipid droplet localized protein-like [Galleria mellonella]
MSRLDLVIFGATGFTGKKVVEQVARGGKYYDNLSWGVAGRSQQKLENVLADVSKLTGKDLSHVRVIVADTGDHKSLREMCSQAKVLVNCCGPYRLYGEPVVRAAIEAKTHYVDISGEPLFMETMQLVYDAQAREAGVYVVSACGFDSIPNDMGVVFLQQNWEGTLNSVESYMSSYVSPEVREEANKTGILNYGTWDSLVYGLSDQLKLGSVRKQLFPEKKLKFEPKLKLRAPFHKRGNEWYAPFLGADKFVVYRTQHRAYFDGERPVQFEVYFKMTNLLLALLFTLAAGFLFVMAMFKFTRNLLLDHPRFFSAGMLTKQGPSERVMNNCHFRVELIGKGWGKGVDSKSTPPNKTMVARVSGVNPGYGATVVGVLHSALTILREQHKMPKGGVLTTGAAFRNTSLIQQLHENDFKFEIIEKN